MRQINNQILNWLKCLGVFLMVALAIPQFASAQPGHEGHNHPPGQHHNHNHGKKANKNANEKTLADYNDAHAAAESEGFNPTPTIMHHIADANEFHVYKNFSIPLPVILWDRMNGKFITGLSSQFKEGKDGYKLYHGAIVPMKGNKAKKAGINMSGVNLGKNTFWDFSITKNVFTIMLAALIMLFVFLTVAKKYKQRVGKAPKGIQSFFEPLITFVRDEIAVPNIGKAKADKFLPYLMTVFFFIWIINMLGLIPFFPGSANVTGNIAVTAILAIFTLLVVNLSGNVNYWKHIFWMPDVPVPVKIFLMPIELIGVLTKPFALMIRLFANITAGHIIVLSLVSLIFIFSNNGLSAGGGVGGAAIAVPFVLFISVIELLVAFLQAFIFTILSAVFIGAAVEEAHH